MNEINLILLQSRLTKNPQSHGKKNVNIFSGDSSKYLADKIAEAYGQPLGKVTIQHFQDGEYQPCFEETIRGNDVL